MPTNPKRIVLDFETRSPVNITECGSTKYINHPEADIVFLGYKVDDQPVNVWYPQLGKLPEFMSLPIEVYSAIHFYAFNVAFDGFVWNIIGPRYGFPRIDFRQWTDVQALCGRFTFPQNLKAAVKAVTKGAVWKDPAGTKLIKEITQPPYNYSPDRYAQFKNYCSQDVTATAAILDTLPVKHLDKKEQDIWRLTQLINHRGLPVDTESINKIKRVTTYYMADKLKAVQEASAGYINTVNQVKKIVEFCRLKGVMIDNCQVDTVSKVLNEYESNPNYGPPEVEDLLKLRAALGKNSVKKYTSMSNSIYLNRIHNNLRYYGTSTGRFSGMGFQAHNLPRLSVKDPEQEIQKYYDTTILDEDPINSAKSLIRSMIKAPEGCQLIVADYSGIENRILFWVTGEWEALHKIKKGLDIYKVVASDTFSVPYDNMASEMRQRGKTIVLGAGFGLGTDGYRKYAEGFGLEVSHAESQETIHGFRNSYSNVPTYWYDNMRAAINAVTNPGNDYSVRGNTFICGRDKSTRKWLKLTLPSGRSLFYAEPKIKEGVYGLSIRHKGINPKTKQWGYRWLPPSRLTENIVQALARDIMTEHMKIMNKEKFIIILSVHDEIICEEQTDKADWRLNDMIGVMRVAPEWATDLPLDANGYISKRYKKG